MCICRTGFIRYVGVFEHGENNQDCNLYRGKQHVQPVDLDALYSFQTNSYQNRIYIYTSTKNNIRNNLQALIYYIMLPSNDDSS